LTLYEIAYTNLYTASTGTPAVATPIGTAEGSAATTYKAGLEDYLVTISDDIVRVMTTFTVDGVHALSLQLYTKLICLQLQLSLQPLGGE